MTKSEFQFVTFNTLLNLRQTDRQQTIRFQSMELFPLPFTQAYNCKTLRGKGGQISSYCKFKELHLLYSNRNSKREKKSVQKDFKKKRIVRLIEGLFKTK